MEYPTFITAGTHALLDYWPFDGIRAPEEVTVHEFGHQFWQGLVANNEFEEAWLDEGFNSYSTGKILELGYGVDATFVSLPGLRLNEVDSIRLQNNPNRAFDTLRQPAWSYYERRRLRLQRLRQARARAAHARGHLGDPDHGARDAHVSRALALRPSRRATTSTPWSARWRAAICGRC